MYSLIKQCIKYIILFSVGAIIYYSIEMLYSGSSYWAMSILGGACFVAIGLINEVLSFKTPLLLQAFIGSVIVTILEFISGCVLNLWLGLKLWDYSSYAFNILGQVCLMFSIFWFFLSIGGIILDDYLRYWLFHEEKPHYRIL